MVSPRYSTVFKPTNADDKNQLKTNHMEMQSKVSKATIRIVKVIGCAMATLFSGLFAFTALAALFISITEGDLLSLIGCAACSFLACLTWSVRRDIL